MVSVSEEKLDELANRMEENHRQLELAQQRRILVDFYKDAWLATVGSDSCIKIDTPNRYAIQGMRDFAKLVGIDINQLGLNLG